MPENNFEFCAKYQTSYNNLQINAQNYLLEIKSRQFKYNLLSKLNKIWLQYHLSMIKWFKLTWSLLKLFENIDHKEFRLTFLKCFHRDWSITKTYLKFIKQQSFTNNIRCNKISQMTALRMDWYSLISIGVIQKVCY